ncbi:MAG: tetratricopeptide repeat protein [Bacteroidota bacterium]
MKKLLLCILLLSNLSAFSQSRQQKVDSIRKLLKIANSDSLVVKQSIELGILTDTSNPLQATQFFKDALSILTSDYSYQDKLQQTALAYDCLGIIERRRNNYEQAYRYYLKALEIKKQSKDTSKIGRSYHNIAMLFSRQEKMEKALFYMKKALPLRKNDSLDYAISLNNYGMFLYKTQKIDSALAILEHAKLYFGNDMRLTDAHTNIAKIYESQKRYVEAVDIYEKSLHIFSSNEKLERMAIILRRLGRLSRKLKKYDLATKYLDQSERLAKQFGDKKLLSLIYRERYRIANAMNSYQAALQHYRIYRKYKDSAEILSQTNKIQQLELAYRYKNQRQQDSIQLAAEKLRLEAAATSQRSQKRLFAILFVLALLALVSVFFLYRYRRKITERNYQKQELEKALLNEKVNFLRFKTDRLLMDNKMRTDFTKELLDSIKELQTKDSSSGVVERYQTILVQLKNQIHTEKRLDRVSEIHNMSEASFEIQLAELYPKLTKAEREVCHLMYLNLSLKEIMNVRNVTLPSIKSTRYRIRKKLQVPKGEELELFIQRLFVEKKAPSNS